MVDRVLLRPLPYPQPDRLAQVVTHFDRGDDQGGQTGGIWAVLADGVKSVDLATAASSPPRRTARTVRRCESRG